MKTTSHKLGHDGELGKFTKKEIADTVAKTEGEKPKQIGERFEAAAEAAKHDKENRELLRIVRETAEALLDAFEDDPESLDMLTEPYVDSIVDARKQIGRAEDEEGVRMMLGAAIKAIGDRRGIKDNEVLVRKVAGSVELVKEWVEANVPKKEETLEFSNEEDQGVGLTDEDIGVMLARLDKMIDHENKPSIEEAEDRV